MADEWKPGEVNEARAKRLELFRERFENGDEAALLEAIECLAYAVLPPWVAQAYCERYYDWSTFMLTLDEAFGVTRKGRKTSLLARREQIAGSVISCIETLHHAGVPLLQAFDQVGIDFGISPGSAKRIYYDPANKDFRGL
jgi:hypothetical protein